MSIFSYFWCLKRIYYSMRNGKFGVSTSGLKYSFSEGFRNNKKTCFLLIIVAFIGILTGVFTAINYCNGATLINFNDFSLCRYLSGELGTLELFFSRFLSYTGVILIVSISSFTVFLIPINFFLIGYRGYLLSLNVSIMVILYGVGGIMTGLLIILPCQLLQLVVIAIYICLANNKAITKKRYGTCNNKLIDKFFIVLIALTIINLAETLLLTLFSSRIILVI